jgi:AraC-like DNA-binding protein
MLDVALFETNVYREYPLLEGLFEVPRLAMAPALYFSVWYFTIPERKFKTTDCLHFVPFGLFLLFMLVLTLQLQASPLFSWYADFPDSVRRSIGITVFASLKVQMVVYWGLSYLQLHRHTRNIQQFASELESISLSWLRYFLLGLAAAIALSLNDVLQIVPALIPFTNFGYLVLAFYLGYFSLRQQEIFPYQHKDVIGIKALIESKAVSDRAHRFSADELVTVKARLLKIVESEKVFLDPNLGLPQLAQKADLSTHDLSYVINEGFGENFFLFINRYRIKEAQRLLLSPKHQHLNIQGIAYESGFRSKSTFNTTFKNMTGLSPSQFIQKASSSPQDDENNSERRMVG